MSYELRAVDQPYHLIIEVYAPYSNSSVGVDNIRLVDCFPGNCNKHILVLYNELVNEVF